MGTSGLILQAQSREEILADKFIAFALRPNRLKNRDLWDIAWLKRQGIALETDLVAAKIIDQHSTIHDFLALLDSRAHLIRHDSDVWEEFKKEMKRFLPSGKIAQTALSNDFWTYLTTIIADECKAIALSLNKGSDPGS
ncbi:MAG: nucleotidyl transferase AbiEii/AbiGii toxin family protein [Spirochaetia bacterium]|nr:nucleotidyl transferase AbiEii/AbiGii toxin family protein [Spirochaetia bacterium]